MADPKRRETWTAKHHIDIACGLLDGAAGTEHPQAKAQLIAMATAEATLAQAKILLDQDQRQTNPGW